MGIGYSTSYNETANDLPSNDSTTVCSSSQKNRKYKWKKDLPDHRDQTHSFSNVVINNLTGKEDLRGYMPPIYDQGGLGSCTANAIAGAFQFDEIKQYREQILNMRTKDTLDHWINLAKSEKKVKQNTFDQWSDILSRPKPTTRSVSAKKRKKKKNNSKIVDAVIELNKPPVCIFETPMEPRKSIIFTPSRLFIYYNERDMEGSVNIDAGAAIRDGMKSVNTVGVCKETDWPYDISKFTEKPPESCYTEAQGLKSKKYAKANTELDQLKAYIKSGFPIIFGFIVFESFESEEVSKTGKMPMPQPDEPRLGGHAVLMCGYDDVSQCFIVRNSWGSDWGDKGYFYMPYEFVNTPGYCDDFWVMYTVTDTNVKLLNQGKDNKKQTIIDDFLVNPCLKKVTLKLD